MQKMKHILRVSILYVAAFVLVGSPSFTVYATDNSESPETYSYDEATGRWSSSKWAYDAATNTYVPVTPPKPAPAPEQIANEPSGGENAEAQQSLATPETGPNSNNSLDSTTNASTTTDIDTNQTVNNTLNSDATTGNAGVTHNQTAGGAKTGDASADTTIINTVHSTVQGDTAGVAHFTADIHGDVTGDIMLYPAIEGATTSLATNINSDTNISSNSELTNNLNLTAKSGDADVSGNTSAGDAESGNAHAVANVLNLINTIIAANKSFVGTINIYGNLNGDILVSPEFIPQLLGSNATSTNSVDTSLSASLDDDQAIINNIKLSAESGEADVSNNTNGGSATTGTADTNLTVLNLTGREVDAKNSLLVFVNVLGKWVGMIVDAPGATAAAIGNGVTSNKTTVNGELTADTSAKITNTIDLSAESGDASVTGNTTGGNAKTGNATASANIANISTSTFKLSDWFGVLFINVFGSWVGSFGIDTEAGKVAVLGGDATPQPPAEALAPTVRLGFAPKSPEPSTPIVKPAVYSAPIQEAAPAPRLTPAQAELISTQMPERKEAVQQLVPKKTTGSGTTNAIMMAIGSAIAAVGAVTGLTGRRSSVLTKKDRG